MTKNIFNALIIFAGFICNFAVPCFAQDSRIKDLVNIQGNRENLLIGFGLIVGLSGTGDSNKSVVTNRAAKNLVNRLGMLTDDVAVVTQSIAAVIVTGTLPAFVKNGDKIDIKVSTIGDAKSLAGGMLLQTELKAGDGLTYVVAQGALATGQADGRGTKVLTVSLVPGGGTVERDFSPNILFNGKLVLNLKKQDFTTNSRIVDKLNKHFHGFYAISVDPSRVEVTIPRGFEDNLVGFISEIELLRVVYDQKSVVVLNERTGTVIIGSEVVVSKVTISHGDLSISVGEKKSDSLIDVKGTTVGDLVKRLNDLGVKPQDLVGIFQALQVAGALNAEIKVM